MASNTGENEVSLRKITDMTRLIALLFLGLHYYYYCYDFFQQWDLRSVATDRILEKIRQAGLFESFLRSKLVALAFLLISLVGVKGKKEEDVNVRNTIIKGLVGLFLFLLSGLVLKLAMPTVLLGSVYLVLTSAGFLLVLSAATTVSRLINTRLKGDIFNRDNETFPQFEQLLDNEYSINLPAEYRFDRQVHRSWVNIINPFRGLLVSGSPGSGKTYFVFKHIIWQHIAKGFSMFVYDFKYNDLTLLAYNAWLKNRDKYAVVPTFYTINFDDLSRSHRCNPLHPGSMLDITDAVESARTILVGLNLEWGKKQGDFFVESSVNFMTAVIWFLRKYNDGEFCTLPHVIELMQADYDKLFTILRAESEIEVFVNPFVTAYLNDAMQQLEGQIGSTKIALARLASPQLYYVLSGSDFTLDINNPASPKIVCMGNNPQKIQIYGAVLSLFITRLVKVVNQPEKLKSSLVFDEFPTIYLNNMDTLIATARSNKVATTVGIQDFSQLKKDYGRDYAEVILNITGNVISGQVSGESAKQLSERFGKIMQDRTSLSISRADTSISKSRQLDAAIPPSTISSLSSGEFVGFVSDNPDQLIDLKGFHSRFLSIEDADLTKNLQSELPVVRNVNAAIVNLNYQQIKRDVEEIVRAELARISQDGDLQHLIVSKSTPD